jgi:hypothetical protein
MNKIVRKIYLIPLLNRGDLKTIAILAPVHTGNDLAPEGNVQTNSTLITKKKPLLKRCLKYAKTKAAKAWIDCQNSPPTSIKGRFHSFINSAKNRLDPHEITLVDLSDDIHISDVEVVYPTKFSENEVRSELCLKLKQLKKTNTMHMIAYSLCIPLSALVTFLPVPNVVLAANLLRIYSLVLSRHSLSALEIKCSSNNIMYTSVAHDHNITWTCDPTESTKTRVISNEYITSLVQEVAPASAHENLAVQIHNFIKYHDLKDGQILI